MLGIMNPLRWVGFQLACLEIGIAIWGSLMRTHFGED